MTNEQLLAEIRRLVEANSALSIAQTPTEQKQTKYKVRYLPSKIELDDGKYETHVNGTNEKDLCGQIFTKKGLPKDYPISPIEMEELTGAVRLDKETEMKLMKRLYQAARHINNRTFIVLRDKLIIVDMGKHEDGLRNFNDTPRAPSAQINQSILRK